MSFNFVSLIELMAIELVLLISIGHVLHLTVSQHKFPSTLCAFDVSTILTKFPQIFWVTKSN